MKSGVEREALTHGAAADLLRDLITDASALTAYEMRGGGASVARVSDLVAFVSSRVSGGTNVEAGLDAFIGELGGRRTTAVDLDLGRPWRRLRGRPVSPAEDVYEIPSAVFDATPVASHGWRCSEPLSCLPPVRWRPPLWQRTRSEARR